MNKIHYKRIVLIFLGLSFSFLLCAQSKKELDSLQNLNMELYSDSVQVKVYTTLANRLNEPQLKIKYANLLLNKVDKNDLLSRMRAYLYLGNAKKATSDFELALSHYFKSLEFASKINPRLEGALNLTIADTYKGAENYDNARKYYQFALRSFDDRRNGVIVDSLYLTGVYINYGDLYLLQDVYDSAIYYFKKAEYLGSYLSSEYYLAVAKGNIAIVYAETGEDVSADLEIKKCISQLLEQELWDTATDFLTYLIDIYKSKNEFDPALRYAHQMLEISLKYGLKRRSESANLKLYEIMQAKGDYKSALQYHKKYVAYKDSVLNLETVQKMADQRTEFEVGQKQTELDLVSAQKKTQEIILYAVIGGALLLLALIIVIYRNSLEKNRINKILEDQKTQLEDLNHTKDKLFSIISHDLRSPVHAFAGISQLIKFAVEDNSQEELLEISDHVEKTSKDLSDLLDGLLSWALQQQGNFKYEPAKINCKVLADEINRLFLYASKSKNITLSAIIDDNLDMWIDKNMTHTILRNLVNNALKFTDEGGEVSISATDNDELIKIQVKDNGIGIPEDKLNTLFKAEGSKASYGTAGEKGLGLGLQLVYEFVTMNKGTVEVESEEGKGTTFIVSLPKYINQA